MKKVAVPARKRAAAGHAAPAAKATAAKPLAPIRKAAQEPVRATRAGIRRTVRAAAAVRGNADA